MLRCIYYVLFTKILQGWDKASGAVFHKSVVELVVKILN